MTTFTTQDREDAERKPMSVNELAVYMEDITDFEESPYRQAATMLRQQQAEIEALKAELKLIDELVRGKK